MKAASLNELLKELSSLTPKRVLEISMRLAKYKKENKELLTYLLFEAHDEKTYIKNIKEKTDLEFREMNRTNLYLTKKSLRKILRMTNKFIRYSGAKETEIELRIHFCTELKKSGIPIDSSKVISNLYSNQLKKINMILSKLHEDLQYDYKTDLKYLE